MADRRVAGVFLALIAGAMSLAACGSGSDQVMSHAELSKAQVRYERQRWNRMAERRAEERAAHARRVHEAANDAQGVAPLTAQLYSQLTGVDQDNFQLAYEICGGQPMARSAREWETSDDPPSIAHAYGLEYKEWARPAVEEGCLRAFADSHAQWEAEIEANSKL